MPTSPHNPSSATRERLFGSPRFPAFLAQRHSMRPFRPGASDSFPARLGGRGPRLFASRASYGPPGATPRAARDRRRIAFDTRTGKSYVVDPRKREVLSEPRAFATVERLRGKVLVAGGENHDPRALAAPPVSCAIQRSLRPATQSFEPDLVTLAEAITRQAAHARQRRTGSSAGATKPPMLPRRQVVSPLTQSPSSLNAEGGRNLPRRCASATDGPSVAGGNDAERASIGALELRDTDASKLPAPGRSVELPPRFRRAFVALPGGAMLAGRVVKIAQRWSARIAPPGAITVAHPPPVSSTNQSYDAFLGRRRGSIAHWISL